MKIERDRCIPCYNESMQFKPGLVTLSSAEFILHRGLQFQHYHFDVYDWLISLLLCD